MTDDCSLISSCCSSGSSSGGGESHSDGRFKELWRGKEENLPSGVNGGCVYVDGVSGMRICVIDVSGPLCSVSIVVPTESDCDDNRGLPHCLEHLVFLGTKEEPRGFLDTFAVRCFTPGTNAFTEQDHTEFTVTGAGAEGICKLLPIFMRHVFVPHITQEGLLAEVHYYDKKIDASAGVVFSELAGRENSREDLCEAAVYRNAFPHSGFAGYSGGRTEGVIHVTLKDVTDFHKRYYVPSEASLLVIGNCDEHDILNAVAQCFPAKSGWEEKSLESSGAWEKPLEELTKNVTEIVRFPADDDEDDDDDDDEEEEQEKEDEAEDGEDGDDDFDDDDDDDDEDHVGSIVLAWRGPSFEDMETIIALEILSRHLSETAASPLVAKYTQSVPTLANDIDVTVSPLKECLIEISLDGVPHYWTPLADEKNPDPDTYDLFSPGVVKGFIYDTLTTVKEKLVLDDAPDSILEVVRRHFLKYTEDMEDEPHNNINYVLTPLFTYRRHQLTAADIENRMNWDRIYHSLEKKPIEYWKNLFDRWFLNNPCVEIIMVPDKGIANTIDEGNAARTEEAKHLASEIPDYEELVSRALEIPGSALSDEVRSRVTDVPPIESITPHNCHCKFVHPFHEPKACVPSQLINMRETKFAQIRICIDTRGLAPHLKSFLTLFQSLFLVSSIKMPDGLFIDHFDASQKMARDLVTACCGLGFSSSGYNTGFLMDMFHIWTISELHKVDLLLMWTKRLLQGVTFTTKGVQTHSSNLLRVLTDASRDSASVCDAASTLVLAAPPLLKKPRNIALQQIPVALSNNLLMQRRVLQFAEAHPDETVAFLGEIHQYLYDAFCDPNRCFVQIFNPSTVCTDLAERFWNYWRSDVTAHDSPKESESFFATPEFVKLVSAVPRGDLCTIVPVCGCESTTLRQSVICDVSKQDADYFPLLVMCEVLSRSEGPLFNRIRSQGYAYDSSLTFAHWDRVLCFSLYECSSPDKALKEFFSIIEEASHDLSATFSPFIIDTARSSLIYEFFSDRASVPELSSSALYSPFKGFLSLDDEDAFEKNLALVDVAAVERVFHKYCSQFLSPELRTTVLSVQPQDVKPLRKVFSSKPFNFTVKVLKLGDFSSMFPIPLTPVSASAVKSKSKKKPIKLQMKKRKAKRTSKH